MTRAVRWPRPPGMHLPGVLARARADRGSLLLAAVVVTLTTLLASAVPPALVSTADAAVADAVEVAGPDAEIVVTVPFEPDENDVGARVRQPMLAEALRRSAGIARSRLGPDLSQVLRPPVAGVTSVVLKVTDGSLLRRFQLAYVAGAQGPAVVWTAGGPPKASVPASRAEVAVPWDAPGPWPVQVGLSEENAAALKVGPGDRIQVKDDAMQVKDVRVSGVFRPADPGDPAWRVAPQLLRAVPGADGEGTRRLAGLLSEESLPDARLAVGTDELTGTVRFAPDPRRLTFQDAEDLTAMVVSLKASSGSSSGLDTSLKWRTGLDGVLQGVRAQVAAATAQASVLLVGLVVTAALVLLLAAYLLARRRTAVLGIVRTRGASLPALGTELLAESGAVALAGGTLGCILARALGDGSSWRWAAPIVLVAALGGPGFGVRAAASATQDRRAPANRSARRSALNTARLRRVTLEAAVLLAAAAAFVTLRQRGLPAGTAGGTGGPVLPATAPMLGAVAGALVLLRLVPLGTGVALARAARSRSRLALFGAARAADTAARPLPFVVLVVAGALTAFALTVSATQVDGLADGARLTVGGDARIDLAPAESGPAPGPAPASALTARLVAAPGVTGAVAARVTEHVPVLAGRTTTYARLVVVDAAAFRTYLAGTALPGAPQLDRLAAAGPAVPALVRVVDGSRGPGTELGVRWNGTTIGLADVGRAPAVGGDGNVVVVDAAAFAAAPALAGAPAAPNTVWLTGPGAGRAAAAAGAGAVTVREDLLRARRSGPLPAGLLRLGRASAGILLLLGLLGVVLGAASSGPARGETLTRLRTLGLLPRETRRIAAGELLPPVVTAVAGGLALGVLLADASLGSLGLRRVTGQATEPAVVVPWASVAVVGVLFLVTVAVVVQVESALRRHERIGEALRTADG